MAESHLQKVICKAVSVALLISGDLEAAENVVADAIQSLDAEDLNTDALFICVSALSIQCARSAADPSVRSKQGEPSFRAAARTAKCLISSAAASLLLCVAFSFTTVGDHECLPPAT